MATTNWNSNLSWANSGNAASATAGVKTDWNPNLNWTNSTSNTTGTNQSAKTGNKTIASNPGGALDKDAFLKLLLVELEYQDPTDPMDTDKMLTQTSQLAALEMQQNTNTAMQKMVETMQALTASFGASMGTAAVGTIGRMATIQESAINLKGANQTVSLKMYLPEDSNEDGIAMEIYDEKGKLVFGRKDSVGKSVERGNYIATWDGRNNDGNYAGDGKYTAKLVYNNKLGGKVTSTYGTYMIEGVVFEDGVTKVKIGGDKIPFDKIKEISGYSY